MLNRAQAQLNMVQLMLAAANIKDMVLTIGQHDRSIHPSRVQASRTWGISSIFSTAQACMHKPARISGASLCACSAASTLAFSLLLACCVVELLSSDGSAEASFPFPALALLLPTDPSTCKLEFKFVQPDRPACKLQAYGVQIGGGCPAMKFESCNSMCACSAEFPAAYGRVLWQ